MTKKHHIEINERELSILLVYSFRYALGRMTYAVEEVVELLKEHWDIIPAAWQKMIQSEIKEAIERGHAGMDYDVKQWQSIQILNITGGKL